MVHRRYGDLPPVLADLLVDGSHDLRLLREVRLSLSVGGASLSPSLGLPSSPGATVVLPRLLPTSQLTLAEGALLRLSQGAALPKTELRRVLRLLAGALSLGEREAHPITLGEDLLLLWPGERLCADHIAAATAPFLCADSAYALAKHKGLLAGSLRRLELVLRRGEAEEGRATVLLEVTMHALLPSEAARGVEIPSSAICVGELTSSLLEVSNLTPTPYRLERTLIPLSPLSYRWSLCLPHSCWR